MTASLFEGILPRALVTPRSALPMVTQLQELDRVAFAEREEWLAHLESSDSRVLLLDMKPEHNQAQHAFSARRGDSELIVGLASEFHGIHPVAVIVDDGRRMVIGNGDCVTFVDLGTLAVLGQVWLESPFFEFLPHDGESSIVVLYETGITCIDLMVAVLWTAAAADIITGCEAISATELRVSRMDSPSMIVSLATGKARTELGSPRF
ncbi:MAG: hypothetical protein NTV21_11025 [Planctomycetota bacterium]|nr:hypothetical protein [Planctomycetota bacterium]